MRNLCRPLLIAALMLSPSGFARAQGYSCDYKRSPFAALGKYYVTRIDNGAAGKNAELVVNATWYFGIRKQKGFRPYIPLIQKTIGTNSAFDSIEFAQKLKDWQAAHGYRNATGVLDVSAFLRFKDYWQDQRKVTLIHEKSGKARRWYAPAEKLGGMWDGYKLHPEKEDSQMLGQQTYAAFQQMMAAARKAGIGGNDLKVWSSARTQEQQNAILKRAGKDKAGTTVAKESQHTRGHAIDFVFDGTTPVDSNDANRLKMIDTKAYRWLLDHAAEFGFRPYFFEPWHWEYNPDPQLKLQVK